MLHQRACRHSARTIENHTYALAKLQSWAAAQGVQLLIEFEVRLLRRFFLELQDQLNRSGETLKSTTLFTIHKNAKVFFRFHQEEGNIEVDPMRRIKPPKVELNILPPFTEREIMMLEDFTCDSWLSAKTELAKGLRQREVANIDYT